MKIGTKLVIFLTVPLVVITMLFGYLGLRNGRARLQEEMQREGRGIVIDLPGTSSLLPHSDDERIARDAILAHGRTGAARGVLVCDTKNLRRGLALALQLAELELPLALVANMADEAAARGLRLDDAAKPEITAE